MARERTFARGEVFPSYIVNLTLDALGSIAQSFRLTLASATTVQVVAGAGDETAVLAIDGALHYRTSTVTRAHPGGGAALFDVYATAGATTINPTPQPNTDATSRTFDLAIVASGGTPTIVPGTVDIFRLIGSGVWDGSAITSLTPLVHNLRATDPLRPVAQSASQTPLGAVAFAGQTANIFSLLASDASTSLFRVSAAGGALAALDVTAREGAAGQARIGAFGPSAEAGLSLGSTGDTVLYRSGADAFATSDLLTLLKTGQSLLTSGYVDAAPAASSDPAFRARIPGDSVPRLLVDASGKMAWGPGGGGAADTNLYRSTAALLKTDSTFVSALDLFARLGASAQVSMGDMGGGIPGLLFGPAYDTSLFRAGAGSLQTGGSFQATGALSGAAGTSAQVSIPVGGNPSVVFGSGGDTNLYRFAADTLKTDDSFIVAGTTTLAAATATAPANGDSSNRVVTSAWVAANGGGAFTQTIGDGVSTTIDITHALGTRALTVAVQSTASPWQEVYPRVEFPSVNVARLIFNTAPTAGAYTATIFGKGAPAQSVVSHASTHNPGGADSLNYAAIAQLMHLTGTLAARPTAASSPGYFYLTTDVGAVALYRSDGTSWVDVASSVNASIAATNATVATNSARLADAETLIWTGGL